MKPVILFILHMPPPVHGASMVGEYIHDSKNINKDFDCHYINLTLAKDINDIGKSGIRKLKDFCKLLMQIIKEIKSINPDLCYVTPNAKGGAFYKDFLVVMLLKIFRQKVIIHYHNKGVNEKQNNTFDNLLYNLFFKNIKVILLAKGLYQDIKKYVNINDVFICPNGIPTQNKYITPSLDNYEILYLSNMMNEKGVWDLVEACSLLKKKGKTIKCNFVGKWGDITEDEFKNKIKDLKLNDCVFSHGAKYGNEKYAFLKKNNIFVFPTFYHNECFPLVLLEAMEQSLPCISTNEGGIPNIIDNGKTGYIVEKHNPKQLADKIEYLLDHPEICKQMGKAGKEKFEKEYTIDIFEKRMINILKQCLTKQ